MAPALAVWISRIFHPFVVPVPTLVAALRLSGASWADTIWWSALCVGIVIVPTTAWLVWERVRRGDGDWYVTAREERRGLYRLGGACLAALLVVMVAGGAPRFLLACLLGGLVATAIGALLNRRIKVSVHSGSAAGCAVLLSHLVPATSPLWLALLAVVGWARLRLGHHTLAQVVLGAAVTGACTALALRAFSA